MKIDEVNEVPDGTPSSSPALEWPFMAKNTILLSCCYGLGIAALFVNVGTTTGAAQALRGTSISTIPFGLLLAGCSMAAFPVQILITRLGSRFTFALGGVLGVVAGGVYIAAVATNSYALLCLGGFLSGFPNSTVNMLRFEVTQFVTPPLLPLGVSAVVGGGVAGGILGPMLSQHTRGIFSRDFQGTYVFLVGLFLLETFLVPFIDFHKPEKKPLASSPHRDQRVPKLEIQNSSQPISSCGHPVKPVSTESQPNLGKLVVPVESGEARVHVQQVAAPPACNLSSVTDMLPRSVPSRAEAPPRTLVQFMAISKFSTGVLAGSLSFSTMAGLMLVFPLAMQAVQPESGNVDFTLSQGLVFSFDDASNALLAHVIVMFFPSFFLFSVMKAIGTEATIVVGLVLLLLGTAIFLAGTGVGEFYSALLLVGIGWNFSYVGSTTQVAALHGPSEKQLVRGFNDAAIFFCNTLAVSTASPILKAMNSWKNFVFLYLGLLAITLIGLSSFWLWARLRLR